MPNSSIYIENKCNEIYRKASCVVNRSVWGDSEKYANRCRIHKK